ncbi:MAG: hypothetical protein KGM15_03955 [Pseudomonadota bacterium]|nr:hypothetical protein [Pseudomonadota bacterium]
MAAPNGWDTGPIDKRDYSVCRVFDNMNQVAKVLVANQNYTSIDCSCCCSCLAYGAPIKTPQGFQALETLRVGAEVHTAAISTGPAEAALAWTPRPVRGSNGTPPSGKAPMVLVQFGAGGHLICTSDQIFLMPGGKVKRASALSVLDQLVDEAGKSVPIHVVRLVEYSGGVHHITTGRYHGEMNGHLLEAAGVVVGDYALQSADFGDLLVSGPTIGTPEYERQFKGHQVGVHTFATPNAAAAAPIPATVRLYTAKGAPIPEGAGMFFTGAQSIDILAKAKLRPFGDRAGIADLNYVFALSRAFYPEIDFWLDWDNPSPTAYACVVYGRKTVVVAGQLLRILGLGIEAYAVIVGACIGRFVRVADGAIVDGPMLPTVQADYYDVGYTMRTVWRDRCSELAKAGVEQVEKLFDMVTEADPNDAKGDAANPLEDPSLACRRLTLLSARLGGTLPPCAGGEPDDSGLRLDRAQPGSRPTEVVLIFNTALDATKAAQLGNYTLKPGVALTSAKIADDPTVVILSGPFAPATAYFVTVANLTTSDGQGLDDDYDIARFVTAGA